jgi:hypothetical protein
MPSDAQRRRAILTHLTPATINRDAQYLTLRFARYPDGHYAYGSPDDLQNCMNARGALEILADFTRLIARWEAMRRPVADAYTVKWFGQHEQTPVFEMTAPTFEAAARLEPSTTLLWNRWAIFRKDGSLAERGDEFGCRGAPALEVRLGRTPTAAEIAEDQREGEDL